MPIGCAVTLRQERVEFLDRMMNVALPRVRDFRGINPKGFDGQFLDGYQGTHHLSGNRLRQDG